MSRKPSTHLIGRWDQKRLWRGRAIAHAREVRKVTQVELARRIGIPQDMLSRLECGRRSPRMDELVLIARALKMPLPQLVAEGEREG